MRTLRALKLVCRSCGSREWVGYLFVGPGQVEAFQAGASFADCFDLAYAPLPKDDPRVVYYSATPNPYRVEAEGTGETI